jgi:tetratricopeptide (TPR) repeat protein
MDRFKAIRLYKIGLSLPQGSIQSQYYFDLSIETDPTFSYPYFEKSVPYNKRGDYAEGFRLLNKAVKLNPKMHLGYRGWLRLVKVKDYQGCIEDLNQLSKIKSENTLNAWGQNIHYLIGLSYLGLQEYEKSIEYFDIAVEEIKNFKNVIVPFYKSIALYKLNQFKDSMKILEECIEQNENFLEAYYYSGKNHLQQGNIEESKYYFERALELYNLRCKIRNPYNEVFFECYRQDIEKGISLIRI